MATNFVAPGKSVKVPAPVGGVTAGTPLFVGSFFGVPAETVLVGVLFDLMVEGIFTLAKTSAQAWLVGDEIFFNTATSQASNVRGVGPSIGSTDTAAANPSATGRVKLKVGPGQSQGSLVALSGTPAPLSFVGATLLTAAQVIQQGNYGIIVVDPAGAVALTWPTAALLVAAAAAAGPSAIGDEYRVWVVNGADAAEAITVTAGAGGTFDANQTATSQVINQFMSKLVTVRMTNVTLASEAYVMYA